ncbi:MAG: geranylgeranyl reductase family protein [Promethearchaeota archaeon]
MEYIQKSFDIIVVGAGTGGTTAARFAAQNGLDVCLIDRKERSQIGNKICGDAVGSEIFNILKITPPRGNELSCFIKGGKLYSPNLKKCVTLTDPKQAGYIVNRLEFGQRLLNEALDAGVKQFLDKTAALDLIYSRDSVSGLKVKLANGEKQELKSKIIIDASGFYSPIRKKIKSNIIEKEISKEDSILCYREIITFINKSQDVIDQEYITIILDQERAPGGYVWYFPKNHSSVNIGLGVFMDYKGKVKDYYQQEVFKKFIKTSKIKIESTGGGVVPVRRPLWSCADNGIMFVGDAACHVNPLHGGGIDPSMRAGYYAATTAAEAITSGDVSIKQLWNYNIKIMTDFGAEFAALDLLRIVLQKLSNNSLNFGLGRDLLTDKEILVICSKGSIKLGLFDMANKIIKGIMNPKLLLDLNYLRIKMNDIQRLYINFPKSIEQFEIWKDKVLKIYDKIKNASYG